jgi:molybdate transport system substrate-binding protein
MLFAALLVGAIDLCAASSLTDVLPKLAAAQKAEATFRFESSAKIAKMLEAGAPCDAVLLADDAWAAWLEEKHLVQRHVIFASNRLVVVVPANKKSISDPAGLAAVERLALAGEAVPAGRYAKAALEHHALWPALAKKVVRADNVRMALAWVARGEADAAIVYSTDARSEPKVKVAFTFAEDAHPKIALTAAAVHPRGEAFVTFLTGDAAQAVLRAAGFLSPSFVEASEPKR